MKILKTNFKDLLIIQSKQFKDARGIFREVLKESLLKRKFIFNAVSSSKKNVIRGLHYQSKNAQGKFISVVKGKIFDVAVDCRKNSKTFGKHFSITLSDNNETSIYIPEGFAHGFASLNKENIVVYNCTNYRDKNNESGIIWNDPDLDIKWPIKKPIISKKDLLNKPFKDLE